MRISLSWIKRLLNSPDLGMTPAELTAKVSLNVAEIERLETTGRVLDGVVVGRVLTVTQHPNADKLKLTTVDIGREAPLAIVCGAPNVAVGQLVAVATIGTTLSMSGPGGEKKSITIKAAKLRGEPSEGMICAEDELGLGSSHDGIMVLAGDAKPGAPLSSIVAAGDSVMVLENHAITHRPDLWGHIGWAREVAAIASRMTPPPPDISWQARGDGWGVDIADDGCVCYYGAVIEGVKNTPSPQWMQDHLNAVGIRPLGLLVDVTNYVMLELGEPMHAFDLRDLPGKRIAVRAAKDGENFTTLDGKTHALASGDILIADAGGKAVALGGIMGGAGSMVREDTTAVLLEAAIFKPERIRKTRQRTGVATDSSARFEKGLYPELAPAALNRAIALIDQLIPSCRITHRFNSGAGSGENRVVKLTTNDVKRITGIDIDPTTQRAILDRLGFKVQGDQVTVPWWRRKDVGTAADLVEEVARHHGYHHILPAIPRLPAEAPTPNPLRAAEHRSRHFLSAQGWDEVQTYAFTSEAWAKQLQFVDDKLIRLKHPLSSEQTVMRPSLVPVLAEAVGRNRKHADAVRIYEIGKRYRIGIGRAGAGLEDETLVVAGACATAGDATPFYAARDAAVALLTGLGHGLGLALAEFDSLDPYLTPGRVLGLQVGPDRRLIGFCGELDAGTRTLADCPERVGYFEIFLEDLILAYGAPKPIPYKAPSRFQRVEREFTWVCNEEIAYGELESATRLGAGALCAGISLITIYRGDPIAPGQKAVSLRVLLQAEERTLEEKDLLQASERIVASVGEKTGAALRA